MSAQPHYIASSARILVSRQTTRIRCRYCGGMIERTEVYDPPRESLTVGSLPAGECTRLLCRIKRWFA